MCLPVRSNGALHTHLNNETVAQDVGDNCNCFTLDIFKVIAGNAHNYFKLLFCCERKSRWQNVNWPLHCSGLKKKKKNTTPEDCFSAFFIIIISLLNTVYSTFYLASPVGHPLKSLPRSKLCFKGICHPGGWRDECTRSERGALNNRQWTRKKHGSHE